MKHLSRRQIKKVKKIPAGMLMGLVAALYLLPLLLMFTNSFMDVGEITRNYSREYPSWEIEKAEELHYAEYRMIPAQASFDQYITTLFSSPDYLNRYINSLGITLPVVFLQTAAGAMAAYGFTAGRFRGKEALFYLYVLVMVLPFQATLVSNFLIADRLGILNTWLSIILPGIFSPLSVFILRRSMQAVPQSLLEAARIDGAGHVRCFFFIMLPLSKGGLASLMILSFIDCWSMVEQPMIFIRDSAKEPLSVYLSGMDTSTIFAGAVLYMLPALWVFLYGQEYFEQGIKLSSFK